MTAVTHRTCCSTCRGSCSCSHLLLPISSSRRSKAAAMHPFYLSLPDLQSMQHDLLLLQLQLQQAEGNMSSATSLPSCSLGLPAASTMSSLLPGPSGSLLGALQLPCTAAAGGAPRVSGLLPLVPAPAANSNCDLKLASSALFPDELMAANSLSSALDNSVAEH